MWNGGTGMPNDTLSWEDVGRPGYFGAKRDQKHREYDDKYGPDRWRIMWRWGEDHSGKSRFIPKEETYLIYGEAYFLFLRDNPTILNELVSRAWEVYDDAQTTVQSGRDFSKQETN